MFVVSTTSHLPLKSRSFMWRSRSMTLSLPSPVLSRLSKNISATSTQSP